MEDLIQYVNPQGPLPEIAWTKSGSLLIVGSGMGVWDELRGFGRQGHEVMAINDMMLAWPERLDHGATVHPDKLPMWGFNQGYMNHKKPGDFMALHSHLPHDWVKYVWPLKREGGTSGLFGVFVGLLMGFDQIVIAGIPCDDRPRFFEDPMTKHEQFGRETVFQEWVRAAEVFGGRVKSLGGRTRELLGEP